MSTLVTKQQMTICFFVNRELNEVLLAKKGRKIGKGKFNGYGGKFEGDESLNECARCECFDECGLTFEPADATHITQVLFKNQDNNTENLCEVFIITKWSGKPKETNEMKCPTWFPINKLPFDEMMAGDTNWVHEAIKPHGKPFRAAIVLKNGHCIASSYRRVDSLD